MDPRRLLTFRVVAHELSFSGAAEKLSLSQPSVSHQVALLETEIGLRLLERGRGGPRLTRAGTVLLEHADHVAWRLQMADTQITDLAQERRDEVRLGSFPTALAGFVPSAIARLRSTDTDLRVLLSEVTAGTLEARRWWIEVERSRTERIRPMPSGRSRAALDRGAPGSSR